MRSRAFVSKTLQLAALEYRAGGGRLYALARRINQHPNTVSKLLHGMMPLWDDDPRVLALGAELGLEPSRCFERLTVEARRRGRRPAQTAPPQQGLPPAA
jgi:hypothetical protein